MVDDKIRRVTEEALEHLAKELEAGRSEALQNYLAAQARFHRYSWGNVLLIHSQRPTATRVAGFHTWQELGRSVRRGEKGIMIYAPIRSKQPELSIIPSEPKALDALRISGFRVAYVFDIAQTEGKQLPAFSATTGDPKGYTDKLKAFTAREKITLTYDPAIAPAQGLSVGGQIRLLPNLPAAEEFSVLAHELAHEMLHHRRDGTHFPITVRETQAEAVAYVVCRAVGLETHSAAADYIKLYSGSKETLAESLSAIHDTSTRILNQLLPEEHHPVQTRTSGAPARLELTRPDPNPVDSMSMER